MRIFNVNKSVSTFYMHVTYTLILFNYYRVMLRVKLDRKARVRSYFMILE